MKTLEEVFNELDKQAREEAIEPAKQLLCELQDGIAEKLPDYSENRIGKILAYYESFDK